MLLTKLRRLARASDSGFTAVASAYDDAGLGAADGGWTEAGAEVVEHGGGRLRAIPVGPPAESGFSAFLDGIQRSAVTLHHGPVPIVWAYAAAVVRARRDRRMTTLTDDDRGVGEVTSAVRWLLTTPYLAEREAVFLPFRLVPPERVEAAGIDRSLLEDTLPEGADAPLFPPALYARAETRVNRMRESLEAALAERWCERADGGWLLVDGSLTLSSRLAASPRAVGVVKSHRTRFFDGDDARVVFGLRAGERSSIFRPRTRSFTPVYSWYLRLRAPEGRGVFWGLIRVEAAADDATLERADEISRWLLAETAPLALPDARWDRLLYPIRDCEEFLRTRAPRWDGA